MPATGPGDFERARLAARLQPRGPMPDPLALLRPTPLRDLQPRRGVPYGVALLIGRLELELPPYHRARLELLAYCPLCHREHRHAWPRPVPRWRPSYGELALEVRGLCRLQGQYPQGRLFVAADRDFKGHNDRVLRDLRGRGPGHDAAVEGRYRQWQDWKAGRTGRAARPLDHSPLEPGGAAPAAVLSWGTTYADVEPSGRLARHGLRRGGTYPFQRLRGPRGAYRRVYLQEGWADPRAYLACRDDAFARSLVVRFEDPAEGASDPAAVGPAR